METIFINTENSKTYEPHKFKLTLADKLNLKDLNKNMALANLCIYYSWKNIKSAYNSKKFLLQLGMMSLICLIDHILFQTCKIILSLLSKNMKL